MRACSALRIRVAMIPLSERKASPVVVANSAFNMSCVLDSSPTGSQLCVLKSMVQYALIDAIGTVTKHFNAA